MLDLKGISGLALGFDLFLVRNESTFFSISHAKSAVLPVYLNRNMGCPF
jgi:hypothetical protein